MRSQAIHYANRIAVDRYSSKLDWFDKAVKVKLHEALETAGINYVKERHEERSLMARNSTERLGG